MGLKGSDLRDLQQAMLEAFTGRGELERLVRFGLDENLSAIAGSGSLGNTVFDLLTWTEARGRTRELVRAARKEIPGNPLLKEVADRLFPEASDASSSPPPGPGATPSILHASAGSDPARNEPVSLFYSYSHQDEKLLNKLFTHLATLRNDGTIREWHDRKIDAGADWAEAIDQSLNCASVIILLVSADFMASPYCQGIELKRAMERNENGEAVVIPVILRPCDWNGAPFGKLQALPKDAKPITTWKNRDEAWADVARGIRVAVSRLRHPGT